VGDKQASRISPGRISDRCAAVGKGREVGGGAGTLGLSKPSAWLNLTILRCLNDRPSPSPGASNTEVHAKSSHNAGQDALAGGLAGSFLICIFSFGLGYHMCSRVSISFVTWMSALPG
jgi:hypothetical protein